MATRRFRLLTESSLIVIELMREMGGRATSRQLIDRLGDEVNIPSRMQLLQERNLIRSAGKIKSPIRGARPLVVWEVNEPEAARLIALGIDKKPLPKKVKINLNDPFLQMYHILAGKPLKRKK